MPTRSTFYRINNYNHAIEQEGGLSRYVNRLIEADMDNQGIVSKMGEAARKQREEFGFEEGSPVEKDTNKVSELSSVVKKEVPKTTSKGDGLNTCKNCGARLMYYKAKCKLCQ